MQGDIEWVKFTVGLAGGVIGGIEGAAAGAIVVGVGAGPGGLIGGAAGSAAGYFIGEAIAGGYSATYVVNTVYRCERFFEEGCFVWRPVQTVTGREEKIKGSSQLFFKQQ
jgi:uncharacterized protein YcfJ